MWKVTIKGLLAHKLRFVLTALAVILGVAFISGTFVLTATIQQTFDDLFANIYKGTDAVVRTHEVIKSDFGSGLRPPVPESLLPQVKATPGVAAASGTVGINYAQVVDTKGKAVGNPGQGAPTLGFAWDPVPELNPFRLVARQPRRRAPQTRSSSTRRRPTRRTSRSVEQAKVLTSKPPKQYTIVGIARFGTVDNLAGASVVLFTLPEAQRIADKAGLFDEIGVAAKSGVSQDQVTANLQEALPPTYETVTGADDHQGEPGRDPEATRLHQQLPVGVRDHRPDRRRRSSSTTRFRSWWRNGCARWRSCARSAPAGRRCSRR